MTEMNVEINHTKAVASFEDMSTIAARYPVGTCFVAYYDVWNREYVFFRAGASQSLYYFDSRSNLVSCATDTIRNPTGLKGIDKGPVKTLKIVAEV